MDRLHHINPAHDTTERCESLAVRVATAAEVHLGLVADDDGKRPGRVSGPPRAIEIVPSTCFSPVTLVRSSGTGDTLPAPRLVDLELDDLDFDVVPDRVVRADRAIDAAAVEESAVDIAQEVGGRRRGAGAVDLQLDRPLFGLEGDDGVLLAAGRL